MQYVIPVTDRFHLAWYLQGLPLLWHESVFYFFLLPNIVESYGYTIWINGISIYLFIHWYWLGLFSFLAIMNTAAAAAKSLQSCPTLCDPIDGSPPSYPIPGILQARILEWVAISFSNAWKWKMKVKSLSCACYEHTNVFRYGCVFVSLRYLAVKLWGHIITPCLTYVFGHAMEYVGSWFPDQGSNPKLMHWKHGILTTGPPGKSPLRLTLLDYFQGSCPILPS